MSNLPAEAPATIHGSFKQGLRQLKETPVPHNYRDVSEGAASTMYVDALKAFVSDDLVALVKLGRNHLPNPALSPELRHRLPQLEKTHLLHTEGDVVRAAELYLLHPLNVVLSKLVKNGHLYCRSEQTSAGGCRTDIRWVYHPNQSNQGNQGNQDNQVKDIAVLEFKNTKILRWSDFAPAWIDPQHAKDKIAEAFNIEPHSMHLVKNAVWVTKQAMKYAANLKIADVAVFDWHAMFVYNLATMKEDAANPTLAQGLWFEETQTHLGDGVTFRIVLLSFLVRALKRHGVIT